MTTRRTQASCRRRGHHTAVRSAAVTRQGTGGSGDAGGSPRAQKAQKAAKAARAQKA